MIVRQRVCSAQCALLYFLAPQFALETLTVHNENICKSSERRKFTFQSTFHSGALSFSPICIVKYGKLERKFTEHFRQQGSNNKEIFCKIVKLRFCNTN